MLGGAIASVLYFMDRGDDRSSCRGAVQTLSNKMNGPLLGPLIAKPINEARPMLAIFRNTLFRPYVSKLVRRTADGSLARHAIKIPRCLDEEEKCILSV